MVLTRLVLLEALNLRGCGSTCMELNEAQWALLACDDPCSSKVLPGHEPHETPGDPREETTHSRPRLARKVMHMI